MSFKRFVGNTSKDTMAQVRRDLGDEAVILSNRRLPNGQIEILAAASDAVEAIVEDVRRPRAAPRTTAPAVETFQDYLRRQARPAAKGGQRAAAAYSAVATAPDDGDDDSGWANSRFDPSLMGGTRPATAQPARATGTARMAPPPTWDTTLPNDARAAPVARPATISAPLPEPAVFRRRPTRDAAAPQAAVTPAAQHPIAAPVPQPIAQSIPNAQPVVQPLAQPALPSAVPPQTQPSLQAVHRAAQVPVPQATVPVATLPAAAPVPAPAAQVIAHPAANLPAAAPLRAVTTEIRLPGADAAAAQASAQLMAELQSLRSALQEQLSALSTTVTASDATRRHPLQTRLMTRLLTAGFSIDVARRIALNAPTQGDATFADAWLQDVLTLNLRCAGADDSIVERGGVYALVGPTGVGKTTTVAKLAARFAVKHGAGALGLITLDGYRVAAHEQLRTYGRILGVPVHLAQDAATLRELLASMKGKKLVLIDTCGVGPRDERLPEMLNMLATAGSGEQKVRPVLLLNAASHAETLDDTARAWRAGECAGTVLTKLDEAARIGGALDCALRYKLPLLGLTNGQRVPEDLHQPNARLLAHLALKPASQLFALADAEGALLGSATTRTTAHV